MAELFLNRDERIALRAQAHHLNVLVQLGNAGLTDALVREVSRALDAHGLIKIKVPGDDREERAEIYGKLADELGAARIQSIGKTLVLFRPIPEEKKKPEPKPATKKPAKKVVAKKPSMKKKPKKNTATSSHPKRPKMKRMTKRAALSR